jgi:hypothetical protein
VSEPEDLELEALQRQLDDAFETTRPRAGFEDELWTRMQAHRPAGSRLRDAWLGLVQGIREAPAVPMAAVAAVLVVVLGAGVLVYSGLGRGSGSTPTASSFGGGAAAQNGSAPGSPGAFGRLPSPVLAARGATAPGDTQTVAPANSAGDYAGPVALTWTGKLDLSITTAPVFRYQEPSTNTADQFATSLGAILVDRPASFLGSYQTTDLSVRVRGTTQFPAHEPTYIILPIATLGAIDGAGGPADLALIFLAQHSLAPSWQYTPDVAVAGDVDFKGNTPTATTGPVPLALDSAAYPIISADEAVRSALASSPVSSGAAGVPTATLTSAELVYTLAVAGDHSFYEPSILFSGTFTVNGTTYVKRVLVPAVDPSQRSS